MNWYCLSYFVGFIWGFGNAQPDSYLGTVGFQDNDIVLKTSLIGSCLSSSLVRFSADKGKFLESS